MSTLAPMIKDSSTEPKLKRFWMLFSLTKIQPEWNNMLLHFVFFMKNYFVSLLVYSKILFIRYWKDIFGYQKYKKNLHCCKGTFCELVNFG